MEASPAPARRDRILALTLSPYLIAATTVAASLMVLTLDGAHPSSWLVLVGAIAGWSSAWSP